MLQVSIHAHLAGAAEPNECRRITPQPQSPRDLHELFANTFDRINACFPVWAIAHFRCERALYAQHGMVECRDSARVAFDIAFRVRSPGNDEPATDGEKAAWVQNVIGRLSAKIVLMAWGNCPDSGYFFRTCASTGHVT